MYKFIVLFMMASMAMAQDQQFVDNGLKLLGLADVDIILVEFDRKLYNGNVQIYAAVEGGKGSYTMFIHKDIKGMDRKLIIAHELIHIKEREEGNFHIRGKRAIYKGMMFDNYTTIPYQDRPWEAYAFENQEKLMNQLKSNL